MIAQAWIATTAQSARHLSPSGASDGFRTSIQRAIAAVPTNRATAKSVATRPSFHIPQPGDLDPRLGEPDLPLAESADGVLERGVNAFRDVPRPRMRRRSTGVDDDANALRMCVPGL